MRHHLRLAFSICSGVIIAAALGCAHTIDVTPPSPAIQETSSQSIADNERVPLPLVEKW